VNDPSDARLEQGIQRTTRARELLQAFEGEHDRWRPDAQDEKRRQLEARPVRR
jgi:hypothetical protein